jgi:hypothetical protein
VSELLALGVDFEVLLPAGLRAVMAGIGHQIAQLHRPEHGDDDHERRNRRKSRPE